MLTLKRSLRWIVPLAVLLVLAICFVVAPMVQSHAASVVPTHKVSDGGGTTPDVIWSGK